MKLALPLETISQSTEKPSQPKTKARNLKFKLNLKLKNDETINYPYIIKIQHHILSNEYMTNFF